MTNPCCGKFELHTLPDMAALYGAICAAVPPYYVCGRGFSNDCLRFSLENGAKAELRFQDRTCEIWLLDCPPEKIAEAAEVYGTLFEELVRRLSVERKECLNGRR